MLHACVERFDVTSTVVKILGTKRGLGFARERSRKWRGAGTAAASAAGDHGLSNSFHF